MSVAASSADRRSYRAAGIRGPSPYLDEFGALLLRWRRDPVAFVHEAFEWSEDEREKFPQLMATWQREVLEALGRGEKRIAVRSGHGVGKTALECWILIWLQLTRRPNKCPVTANREDQLRDVVWAELNLWVKRLKPGLSAMLEVTADRFHFKDEPALGFAVARTARKEAPEAFQGFHAKHLAFLAEEASGIPDIIFEVGEGAMSTPGAITVMAGNPTRASGYFFNAFHKMSKWWWTRRVSCLEVIEEGCPWADPAYPERIADEYGPDSNVYRIRVLGKFPTSDDDAVIPRQWIADAVNRDVEATGDEVWGLDVARFGDDRSALCKRRGNVVPEPVRFWKGKDLMTICGEVKREYDNTLTKPTSILVDSIGLGAGAADRLRELGLPVTDVNVGESAPDTDRFMRLRDELIWRGREWFGAKDCCIPEDGVLIGELGDIHYDITSTGKIKAETKDEMKKRGVRSPDGADAFFLTLAETNSRASAWSAPLDYSIFYPEGAFA